MVFDVYCGVVHMLRDKFLLRCLMLDCLVGQKLGLRFHRLLVELLHFCEVKFRYHRA